MAAVASPFAGKRVLVTGGAIGIGRAIVERMVKEGASVIALDKSEDALKALKEALPSVQTVVCDVRDWNETRKVVKSIGPIHHLVNNAGILGPVLFLQIDEDDFDRLYAINVKAVINITQTVAAGMIEHGIQGSIVNVSSVSSRVGTRGLSLYGSSKAAVSNLTQTMALELGTSGIRVNAICPGMADTSMTHSTVTDEEIRKGLRRAIIRRLIKPQEIADLVVFLLGPNSAMINGQSVFIDGGLSAI